MGGGERGTSVCRRVRKVWEEEGRSLKGRSGGKKRGKTKGRKDRWEEGREGKDRVMMDGMMEERWQEGEERTREN
jgi:hypothetical protein